LRKPPNNSVGRIIDLTKIILAGGTKRIIDFKDMDGFKSC
jgi:hypothetical protein